MANPSKYDVWRAEAEVRLKSLAKSDEDTSGQDVTSLLHELRVYQLELEMQNQELREAQYRLEESRDQYADLFEFAPMGYFILDKNGLILNCNLTGCGLLGVERMHLRGKPFGLFVSQEPHEMSTFRKYLRRVFQSGTLESCELKMRKRGQLDFESRLDAVIMKDDTGLPNQCRMAINDISGEKDTENMRSMIKAALNGQENERERIAAELHDSVNPLLSIASLNAESLMPFFKKNKKIPYNNLKNVISLLGSAIQEVKEISGNLSPTVLKNFGLTKAVEELCNKVNQTGQLTIDCLIHNLENRLELAIELALYRITQELLNNIINHATASEAELQLIRHQGSIVLMVSDNGKGFSDPPEMNKTKGFGFNNIHSRVQSLSGTFIIDSAKGKGTIVTVELPI